MHFGASFNRLARLGGLVILLAVGQFVAVVSASMWFYPGGNDFDRQAPGYSLRLNTLSDLGDPVAYNGQPNPVWSVAYKVSLIGVFVAFVPLWLFLPTVFSRAHKLGIVVSLLGLSSVVGGILVGLFPTGKAHAIAIGVSSVPGLAALVLATIGVALARAWALAVLSIVLLAVGLPHFWQYVDHFWLDGPWTEAAPATQKFATLAAVAWMAAVALAIRRTGLVGRP